METATPNLFERFNQWITESIMVKLFSIGFLILILLMALSKYTLQQSNNFLSRIPRPIRPDFLPSAA